VVASQLRSSCLTLLRNVASITCGVESILHGALLRLEMKIQADKALEMANQANKLKSASRSTRNQAKMYYEWDTSDTAGRSTKRQKETDDALAKMRAAKKARGLGNGIQLPSNMADATDLVILNLRHFESVTRPKETASRDKSQVSLDFIIDAIMTNGKSLGEAKGGWFDRDGGSGWIYDPNSGFSVAPNLLSEIEEFQISSASNSDSEYYKQCQGAAANAFDRILSVSSRARSGDELASLSHQLLARLALTLKNTKSINQAGYAAAKSSLAECRKVGSDIDEMEKFIAEYPLVAEAIAVPRRG
jgi:symplekin